MLVIFAKVSFGRALEAWGGLGELGGCFGMLWEALGRLWGGSGEALGRLWGGFGEAWGRLGGGLEGLGKTLGPARRPAARRYI